MIFMNENELSKIIVDCCYRIHTKLGPGLFESVYEEVLSYELEQNNLKFERQKEIPVIYDDKILPIGFRADLIIEGKVIVEIKSIEKTLPVHTKQLLTYLKLTNTKFALIITLNQHLIKNGITRIVNKL